MCTLLCVLFCVLSSFSLYIATVACSVAEKANTLRRHTEMACGVGSLERLRSFAENAGQEDRPRLKGGPEVNGERPKKEEVGRWKM